jgi:glycosyltransferase involved in cell wall biosynthesis
MLGNDLRQRLFRWICRNYRTAAQPPFAPKRIFVDLSTIAQHDAGTGIQRVVRAIWRELCSTDLQGWSVIAVAATAKRGYCAIDGQGNPLTIADRNAPLVDMGEHDIFLGLDLAAHRLWRHRRQLRRWKRQGAVIAITIYDLLPLRSPEWFPPTTVRHFSRWIKIVEQYADVAFCISQHVMNDLSDMVWHQSMRKASEPRLELLPLCGDIAGSRPTMGVDDVGRAVMDRMSERTTLLMVGTIEPRKGQEVMLDAFDHMRAMLGAEAPDLVVVGRPGWRTQALQRRMSDHPDQGCALRWLDNASDELLEALYDRAALVVMPSRGEGFGLPVTEALRHGRKVLARDIPVFRELQSDGLYYFQSDAPAALAEDIMETLGKPDPVPGGVTGDWGGSVAALLDGLGIRVRDMQPDAENRG